MTDTKADSREKLLPCDMIQEGVGDSRWWTLIAEPGTAPDKEGALCIGEIRDEYIAARTIFSTQACRGLDFEDLRKVSKIENGSQRIQSLELIAFNARMLSEGQEYGKLTHSAMSEFDKREIDKIKKAVLPLVEWAIENSFTLHDSDGDPECEQCTQGSFPGAFSGHSEICTLWKMIQDAKGAIE